MGLWATLKEGLLVAFDSLRANKVRSGLTILGVTIGVMVVLVMAAMVQGLNSSFKDIIASAGPTTFYVFPRPGRWGRRDLHGSRGGRETSSCETRPWTLMWTRELARLDPIRQVAPGADFSDFGYHARSAATATSASRCTGWTPTTWRWMAATWWMGRFFTASEESRRRPVAVIDSATAADLFGGLDPLGRRFNIGRSRASVEAPFQVVGVYRPPDNLSCVGLAVALRVHSVRHPEEVAWARGIGWCTSWSSRMKGSSWTRRWKRCGRGCGSCAA